MWKREGGKEIERVVERKGDQFQGEKLLLIITWERGRLQNLGRNEEREE